ncbi:MAG: hypothetical protein II085_02955 [Alphaproteobacteria bacterium]|nr:hypothetical protein [Alphaproteobacteria bacterium]
MIKAKTSLFSPAGQNNILFLKSKRATVKTAALLLSSLCYTKDTKMLAHFFVVLGYKNSSKKIKTEARQTHATVFIKWVQCVSGG